MFFSDTDIGMDDYELDKIFEEYYTTNSTLNDNILGIGLAIVKEVTQITDSQIMVKSKLGSGSTFKICLKK